jgi:hypothetical protein
MNPETIPFHLLVLHELLEDMVAERFPDEFAL